MEAGSLLRSKCGSPRYVAPEVLQGDTVGYDELCDLWSCGSLMYNMLSGQHAFPGKNPQQVLARVMKMKFTFAEEYWHRISDDCKKLIGCLLVARSERITAQQALKNPWVESQAPHAEDAHLSSDLVNNMRRFHGESRFKQVALNALATQLDHAEIEKLRNTFVSMDTNQDGHLSMEEFKMGISNSKQLLLGFEDLWKDIDTDHDGFVDYTEFIAATLDRRVQMQKNMCWRVFRQMDTNHDGKISIDEFKKVLEDEHVLSVKDKSCTLSAESDWSSFGFSKGYISFEEFVNLLKGVSSTPSLNGNAC